jgi:hypothetical protein
MALALLCHYLLQVASRICLGFYLGVVLPDIGDYLSRKFNEMDFIANYWWYTYSRLRAIAGT